MGSYGGCVRVRARRSLYQLVGALQDGRWERRKFSIVGRRPFSASSAILVWCARNVVLPETSSASARSRARARVLRELFASSQPVDRTRSVKPAIIEMESCPRSMSGVAGAERRGLGKSVKIHGIGKVRCRATHAPVGTSGGRLGGLWTTLPGGCSVRPW